MQQQQPRLHPMPIPTTPGAVLATEALNQQISMNQAAAVATIQQQQQMMQHPINQLNSFVLWSIFFFYFFFYFFFILWQMCLSYVFCVCFIANNNSNPANGLVNAMRLPIPITAQTGTPTVPGGGGSGIGMAGLGVGGVGIGGLGVVGGNPFINCGMNPQLTRPARRLYVGNLPVGFGLNEQILSEFFSQCCRGLGIKTLNPVLSVWLNVDQTFGFIEFRSVQDATLALTLFEGLTLGGRQLRFGRPADYAPAQPHLKNYIVGETEPTLANSDDPPKFNVEDGSPAAMLAQMQTKVLRFFFVCLFVCFF